MARYLIDTDVMIDVSRRDAAAGSQRGDFQDDCRLAGHFPTDGLSAPEILKFLMPRILGGNAVPPTLFEADGAIQLEGARQRLGIWIE